MRTIIYSLLLLSLVWLTACSTTGPASESAPLELPTMAAPVTLEATEDTNTPRNGVVEEEINLPPTFTPAPTLPPNEDAPLSVDVDANGTPVSAGDQQTYTVQAGDTLAEIAAAFDVTVQALADANRITNIDTIEVGDVLTIP